MTKAVEPTEDKSLFEKGIEKLTEIKDDIMPAHEPNNAVEEVDERRPLWVRLAMLSVPIIVGVVVKRALNRRAVVRTAKAIKAKTKASRAKPISRRKKTAA